jgi:hypothetical protein
MAAAAAAAGLPAAVALEIFVWFILRFGLPV